MSFQQTIEASTYIGQYLWEKILMDRMREMGSVEMITLMLPMLGIKNPFAEKLEREKEILAIECRDRMSCCLPFLYKVHFSLS